MLYETLDKKSVDLFLQEGERGHFRLTAPIRLSEKSKTPKKIEIEMLTEGEWAHPMAKDGMFRVTAERITNWIQKFKDAVVGKELPLDFEHTHNSRETPGWVTNLFSKVMPNGKTSLFASLNITDSSVLDKIKNGSLKYISAEVDEQYEDKMTGIVHDIIRGAALTNYPYLKNLSPISLNFEEVVKHEADGSQCFTTLGKEATNMEKDFIIDLEEDLEFLSAEDIELAEKKGYGYPLPGNKGEVKIPKVKLPKELKSASEEAKAAFFSAFSRAYSRTKDLAKATAYALGKAKAVGNGKPKMDDGVDGVLAKLEEGFKSIFASFGKKEPEKKDTEVVLNELSAEVVQLREFKLLSQKKEDAQVCDQFKLMTPAAKAILLEMLNQGRTQTVKFEDAEIPVRNLVLKFVEEMKNAPTINMFEQKSTVKVVKNSDDLDTKAKAYQKEHKCSYRVALEEVSRKED